MPLPPFFSVTRLALLAVVAMATGCGSGTDATDGAMPPPQVTVVTLKPQAVDLRRELPGRVSALLVAEVRPQVGGIVKQVLFTEGSEVKAGQLLYQLDDAVYQAGVSSADAARLKAQAVADNARRNAARGAELQKTRLISEQDNDALQAALQQAEADLAAARAAVETARINLAYARITAPIRGRIGKSVVTRGALVTANQGEALATIQQLDQVYVDVTQSSSEWLQLRGELGSAGTAASKAVQLTLEDGTAYPQAGRLQFTDVTVDQTTGSFLLRVLVPNPQRLLLPGMYVRATINEGTVANGLLAPQQGITRDPKGNATAMVVDAEGKAQQRPVHAARTVGDQWLISEGLTAGDRVIVEGLQKIMPGMPVVAVEAGTAAAQSAAAPAALGR